MTFCLFSKSHDLKIMILWVVEESLSSFYFNFLLYFLSWQQCNFGAATKTPLEKIVFGLGQGQVSSLRHPRTCPGCTLHPVGIKVTQPRQPGAWDKKGTGGIWGRIQRKELSNPPEAGIFFPRAGRLCQLCLPLFLLFLFHLDQNSICPGGPDCSACPNASQLWTGSFRSLTTECEELRFISGSERKKMKKSPKTTPSLTTNKCFSLENVNLMQRSLHYHPSWYSCSISPYCTLGLQGPGDAAVYHFFWN